MKGISNWLKAALLIGLIVLIASYRLLAIQIEPYIHVEYTIFPAVFYLLLALSIGLSCGWIIKVRAENAAQYCVMAAIMFLTLLIPVLYYIIPLPWLPSFFAVFVSEYKIESLVFGLFLVLAIKSQLARVKAKGNSV